MGQCSTLPAEARASSSIASTRLDSTITTTHHNHHHLNHTNMNYQDPSLQDVSRYPHRYRFSSKEDNNNNNKLASLEHFIQQHDPAKVSVSMMAMNNRTQSPSIRNDTPLSVSEVQPQPQPHHHPQQHPPQSRDPDQQPVEGDAAAQQGQHELMEIDSRDEAPMSFPQPPEIAIRTRCYRLNLDSNIMTLPSHQKQHVWLGPFSDYPPPLTYSSSEESTAATHVDATLVAIRTAQIFRGITVSRDGTILTQNARATRSNRGNHNNNSNNNNNKQAPQKRGEKSRQAAKIDKANDLVEESILTGKSPESDTPAHMVSLVPVGEYDDMKHLVRDGAKKLRDASQLPDEALYCINRPRVIHTGGPTGRPSSIDSALNHHHQPPHHPSLHLQQQQYYSSGRKKRVSSPSSLAVNSSSSQQPQLLPPQPPPPQHQHPQQQSQPYRSTPLVQLPAEKLQVAVMSASTTVLSTTTPAATGTGTAIATAVHSPTSTTTQQQQSAGTSLITHTNGSATTSPPHNYHHNIHSTQPPSQQSTQPPSTPKLKSHPRDNRSGRREDRAGMRMRLDGCHPGVAAAGDADWSHAWNIWNCGAATAGSTVSPLHQPSSPKDASVVATTGGGNIATNHAGGSPTSTSTSTAMVVVHSTNAAAAALFEGRESMFGMVREGGITNRT